MSNRNILLAAAGASTGNPNAWDISYAAYDAGADAGDVSKAAYTGLNEASGAQVATPSAMAFSTDGTKMYIVGNSGAGEDTVFQYTLPGAWSLTGRTYASKSFSVASQETDPRGLAFKSDGTKMYVVGSASDTVYQYSLSTAWDVSTASYDSISFSVASQEIAPQGLTFKPDGTKMYVIGSAGDDVNEYDLSTAWDVSSASYVQNFSVATQELVPSGVSFLGDGTKMYVTGTDSDGLYQYDLSTPWDISTASFVQTFSLTGQTQAPVDIFIKPDGSMFFMISSVAAGGAGASQTFQYVIGGFSVAAQDVTPTGIFFKPDGTKMYIIGSATDSVYEYDLSTAWDITTASYLQNFSVAAQDIGPADIVFKDDGLKMYFAGDAGDAIYEYSLSVAWDISSASYVQNFSVASQETQPRGPAFKTDGTKMYVVGPTNDTVYQYSLSTAWDISSASYDSVSFSVASQDTTPQDLKFKPDGTKMYILGSGGDDVNEYSLSTPWDVSSASYVQNTPVLDGTPIGLFWRDNGEEFFIIGSASDRVLKYTISST